MGSRGQPVGALHSRTTEKSIAAAKKANTKVRDRIPNHRMRGRIRQRGVEQQERPASKPSCSSVPSVVKVLRLILTLNAFL